MIYNRVSLFPHTNIKYMKKDLTIEQVKKLPYNSLNRMLNKLRKFLKKDKVVKKMFKEYKIDIDEIDYIPMMFDDLDVSAKTDHGIIMFSYKLLMDGDFFKDFSYGTHEITHWIQQTTGTKPTQSSDDGNYLKNPYEQEAFTNQVEYIENHFGEDEAEKYVDNLLEYHNVDSKKEKEKTKETLMANCLYRMDRVFSKYSYINKQTYSDNNGEYFVKDIINLAENNDNKVKFNVNKLSKINFMPSNYEKNDEVIGSPEFIERANKSELKYPIIVIRYKDGDFIADGIHRLWKAKSLNKEYINGYLLKEDDLKHINKLK